MPGISGWWIRVKVRWALARGGGVTVSSLHVLLQCSPTHAVSVLLPWETGMSGSPKFNIGTMSMVCVHTCVRV